MTEERKTDTPRTDARAAEPAREARPIQRSPPLERRDATRRTLFSALLDARAAFGGNTPILEDAQRKPLTYAAVVTGALALGRKLADGTKPGERVGVFLPSVPAAAVVFFGLHAFGRVPAMLNFTAGPANLVAACKLARIGTIVTSRRFVDEGDLDEALAAIAEGRRVVYLEDVRAGLTSIEKLRAAAESLFAKRLGFGGKAKPDDEGVVLFTSGSEGMPKAVVLTHANLVANAEQVMQHARGALSRSDVFFNPLPVFHSFGLTAGMLLGVLHGIRVFLHPSPLHYRQIPKLLQSSGATFLLATDTFLQGYARAAGESDLSRVRFIIAGAERVREETRRLWGRYGATILEGYGATECGPVLSCNLPDRNRAGTVGPLLPGLECRLEPVEGISEGARLHVRGPNVMAGYIDPDNPDCLIAPPDGWHDTGDIVSIQEGVVSIRGRAKRFAKIGGEMVSLAAVESVIQELWPDHAHVVVALADKRKGEQLILL
ncbi:MAG: 2-acylglycerophosphoethanolamine acyltransferase, partial [Salinarimonadaceae bacterium]